MSNLIVQKINGKEIMQPLGEGQTWQNVKSDRAEGVAYTNSTGRTIAVSVRSTNSSYVYSTGKVDGNAVFGFNSRDSDTSTSGSVVFLIVPNGSTYEVSFSGGSINTWRELR